jgi:hypothetical protein
MRCLCIGICHMKAVYTILKEDPVFSSIYETIEYYPVFAITEEEMKHILNNIVPKCDLVLSQPVSDGYKDTNLFSTKTLRANIKIGTRHLILPNCYFTGYDPVPFQTTNNKHEIISNDVGISYYPSISLKSLLSGDIKQACIDWCNMEAYTKEELAFNYEKSIVELKQRESKVFDNGYGTDVVISDYIEANYKSSFLFHTYNHPTNLLLIELSRRVMNLLGIPNINLGHKLDKEILGNVSIPPPPSVYYGSGMDFEYPHFVINDVRYTTIDVMKYFESSLKELSSSLHNQWLACISYGKSKLK